MFFFKQKTAYEMRISDWSSDVCSSDLKSAFPDSFVMSTGGGAPCFFNNMDWMNRTGITMYLRAHPGEIARRLENQREERPLLREIQKEELETVIARRIAGREQFYLQRSEEHTSELQSLMRISYAVFCLKKKNKNTTQY